MVLVTVLLSLAALVSPYQNSKAKNESNVISTNRVSHSQGSASVCNTTMCERDGILSSSKNFKNSETYQGLFPRKKRLVGATPIFSRRRRIKTLVPVRKRIQNKPKRIQNKPKKGRHLVSEGQNTYDKKQTTKTMVHHKSTQAIKKVNPKNGGSSKRHSNEMENLVLRQNNDIEDLTVEELQTVYDSLPEILAECELVQERLRPVLALALEQKNKEMYDTLKTTDFKNKLTIARIQDMQADIAIYLEFLAQQEHTKVQRIQRKMKSGKWTQSMAVKKKLRKRRHETTRRYDKLKNARVPKHL